MDFLSKKRNRKILWWTRLCLITLGTVLLGDVGSTMLYSKLFQVYENRQLNQALKDTPPQANGNTASAPLHSSVTPGAKQDEFVATDTVLGRIEIDRINVSVIILEGTEHATLRRAVGHIPGTALPGETGNVAIAGHRDTFFRPLQNIRKDDDVTLTTLAGVVHYRVDSTEIVAAEDVGVLKDSGASILTLVTCYPFYYIGAAPKRFVVRAHRV